MSEEQPQNGPERKKLSVGEALQAMHQGRAQKSGSSLESSLAGLRQQRMPPAYWLQHLQHHLQKGRDQLFDAISDDSGALSSMHRRGLMATELFHVPAECVQRVVPMSTPALRIPRSQELEATCYGPLDYGRRFHQEPTSTLDNLDHAQEMTQALLTK